MNRNTVLLLVYSIIAILVGIIFTLIMYPRIGETAIYLTQLVMILTVMIGLAGG